MTPELFDRDYWEDRYGSPGSAWSGNPNPVLVAEVAALAPGRALDVGCGEGADAIWLAEHGWQVTGVDISVNALTKARERAAHAGAGVAERIRFQQHDMTVWRPEPGSFELVSAQFMHPVRAARDALFRALAAAVAPGGTLLIVGHDLADAGGGHAPGAHAPGSATGAHAPGQHEHLLPRLFTADDILSAIAGTGLHVETAESRLRQAGDREHPGAEAPGRDIVVRASRKRPSASSGSEVGR